MENTEHNADFVFQHILQNYDVDMFSPRKSKPKKKTTSEATATEVARRRRRGKLCEQKSEHTSISGKSDREKVKHQRRQQLKRKETIREIASIHVLSYAMLCYLAVYCAMLCSLCVLCVLREYILCFVLYCTMNLYILRWHAALN